MPASWPKMFGWLLFRASCTVAFYPLNSGLHSSEILWEFSFIHCLENTNNGGFIRLSQRVMDAVATDCYFVVPQGDEGWYHVNGLLVSCLCMMTLKAAYAWVIWTKKKKINSNLNWMRFQQGVTASESGKTRVEGTKTLPLGLNHQDLFVLYWGVNDKRDLSAWQLELLDRDQTEESVINLTDNLEVCFIPCCRSLVWCEHPETLKPPITSQQRVNKKQSNDAEGRAVWTWL